MPRIPQGEFDQNPSTRVGGANLRQMPDPVDAVGKAMSNLTGAMAQLQDQSERTEAYSTANQVKQDYLNKKVQYMSALESANGSGMADFFDPTDNNPDVTKRKRIQRPVNEMYQEMVASYEDQKKGVEKLARGDIAGDLMRQYVGDDLIQLQMSTNKHINRVREKEVEKSSLQNFEQNLLDFSTTATDPNATPEQIEIGISHMNNRIKRELGVVSSVLGDQKTAEVQQLLDREYTKQANQILSTGITTNTVAAAESLISRIGDAGQKSLAMTRLENTRRATGEVKNNTLINTTKDMNQTIATSPILKNEDYAKAATSVKHTMNMFIDPKYSTLKEADKHKAATDLTSTMVAKRMLQEMVDVDMQFLFNPAKDVIEGVAPAPADGNWNEVYRGNRGVAGGGITSEKGIKGSDELFSLIKGEEGFRSKDYKDQGGGKGVTTNGYGNTDPKYLGKDLTKDQAETIMRERVGVAEKELSGAVTNKNLNQNQMNVLLDMHYNLGIGNMQSFIEVVNSGTPEQIEQSLKQYTKATKRDEDGNPVLGPDGQPELIEMGGLVKRTAARLEMWRKPATGVAFQSATRTDQLKDTIGKELEASGLAGILGNSGLTETVKQQVVDKMRAMHSTMKDSLPDLVVANNPSIQGREKFEKIHQIAGAQGFGDPSLVGKKEIQEFKAVFTSTMAKDPMGALTFFNQKIEQGGSAYEGDASYKRALAIDLADKDSNLAYLIPLADADYQTQAKMISNASAYKKVIEETDVTPNDMQMNFEVNKHQMAALAPLMKSNPSMYDGIKQAIMHSAATRIQSKSDVNSAMKDAVSEMSSLYTSHSTSGSTFFAVNRSTKNFAQENPRIIDHGIQQATALPQLTDAEKFSILQQYNNKPLARREDGTFVQPPREKMDWLLQRLVTIEPDGRFPNMHVAKINGVPLDINNKLMKFSADDILKYGQEKQESIKQKYSSTAGR